MSSLSYLFDEKYEALVSEMDAEMDSFDKLIYLNQELFSMIENSISIDLLARLYSSQLVTRGEKHLLDRSRFYYRLLRQIMMGGQTMGQLTNDLTVNEMVKMYALCERALIYRRRRNTPCFRYGDISRILSIVFIGKFVYNRVK